jgi:hypothetical protein
MALSNAIDMEHLVQPLPVHVPPMKHTKHFVSTNYTNLYWSNLHGPNTQDLVCYDDPEVVQKAGDIVFNTYI